MSNSFYFAVHEKTIENSHCINSHRSTKRKHRILIAGPFFLLGIAAISLSQELFATIITSDKVEEDDCRPCKIFGLGGAFRTWRTFLF